MKCADTKKKNEPILIWQQGRIWEFDDIILSFPSGDTETKCEHSRLHLVYDQVLLHVAFVVLLLVAQ